MMNGSGIRSDARSGNLFEGNNFALKSSGLLNSIVGTETGQIFACH